MLHPGTTRQRYVVVRCQNCTCLPNSLTGTSNSKFNITRWKVKSRCSLRNYFGEQFCFVTLRRILVESSIIDADRGIVGHKYSYP
jgi:hypothetical protein